MLLRDRPNPNKHSPVVDLPATRALTTWRISIVSDRTKRLLSCTSLCLLLIAPGLVRADGDAKARQTVMVPMRDGIKLATNIYLPEGNGPWPVLLTRTPYNKNGLDRMAPRLTKSGYVLVAQDVRGRFASEGVDVPFENDMPDGYDTVEWLAAQKFCTGKVGIFGTSASGITSNLAAASAPPHLMAAHVAVAPDSLYLRSRFVGGAFKESHSAGWLRAQGLSESKIAEYRQRAYLDQRTKNTDFLFHRQNVQIPIYNVGGWHDIFAEGTLSNFVFLQNEGREGARGNQKVFMGAFGHGRLEGDLEYPHGARGAAVDSLEDQIRWWDYWLKGTKNGIMQEPAVSYYLMAAARKGHASPNNRIVKADSWPPKSEKTRYYLSEKFGISLQAPEAPDASQSYSFDPDNPVPTIGGQNLGRDVGPKDQRAIKPRPDYLRFQTEPLTQDVTVAGHIDMELWAATDGLDTDFVVKLVDIYPDGYEALILDYPLRTRFRFGREVKDVKMMTPGKPELLKIDMWSTANVFEAGHRIGIHITSSNFPRFDVNPNTGGPIGEAKAPRRAARNTIFFDATHPSAIVLPVVKEKL
jgi:predicted acyl esterase